MSSQLRLASNCPGPFYGIGGCTACGAPEAEAPTLLSELTDENWETYFVRQPETPEELEQACRAVQSCCLDALRYGGTDPAIIRRLGNSANYCDHLLPPEPRGPLPNPPRAFSLPSRSWWRFWD
jgi:hypothetical protein